MTSSNQEPSEAPPKDYRLDDYIRQNPSLGISVNEVEISGRVESKAEQESRLRREEEIHQTEQKLKFWRFVVKEAAVYAIALVLVLGLGWVSISTLRSTASSQADKDWAKATLAAVGSAVAGYLFGKNSSN
jgi:anti-sigma-K factor RskA